MPEQPFRDEDVVLRFSLAPMDNNRRTALNLHEEYVIVRDAEAVCGIVEYGRVGSRWFSPWHTRAVTVELLRRLAAKAKVIMELSRDKAEANCRIRDLEGWERSKDAEIANLKDLLRDVVNDCPLAMRNNPLLARIKEALK